MKLKNILTDVQIESLFEQNRSELHPKEIYNRSNLIFRLPEEEEVVKHVDGMLSNIDTMFRDMFLNGDSYKIDIGYYRLIKETFDQYYSNLCATIRNGLTYAIIIPNLSADEIKDEKFADYLEKTINSAFHDKPAMECVFKTCIVRADKYSGFINVRFIHLTEPDQDRVYNIHYDEIKSPSGKDDGKFSICFRVCLLEDDSRDKVQVKYINNEQLKNKKDYRYPDGLNFWNKIFNQEFKHMMEFEHIRDGNHDCSGIVLHNVV